MSSNCSLEMDRNVLIASIRRLRARIEQLLRELEEVSLEISTYNTKYARFLNEDAPVYRLPAEIMASIFLLVQRNFDYPPHRSPTGPLFLHVKVSHVSHRWRAIIFSTPLLWNTISLHVSPTKDAFERVLSLFDAHLLHSQQCFLDVDLHFHNTEIDFSPYLRRLAAHASRWRRLSIAAYCPDPHIYLLKAILYAVEAPILESLSLHLGISGENRHSPRKAYPTIESAKCPPSAPALSFVRLAGYAIGHMHPPLQAITTLHLDAWTHHYITPEQFTGILATTSRLVNLSLNQFVMNNPGDPTSFPQPVTLSYLRQLRLCGPLSSPARFCALIDAPGLHGLTLSRIDQFEMAPLPNVRHVTLELCDFDATDVTQLARATPGVVSLTVEATFGEIFEGLLPGDGPGAAAARPWPALRTLELWSMDMEEVPHLCHLVFTLQEAGALEKGNEDRHGDGGGLSKIRLDRRGRRVMRAKHRLDWLEERVEVQRSGVQEIWPLGLGYTDPHYEDP